MENEIFKHRQAVVDNIYKSFEDDIQKAHYHGEIHKNGKWYWNSQAAGGKGDWRVIKKQKEVKEKPNEVAKIINEQKKSLKEENKIQNDKRILEKMLRVLNKDYENSNKIHFEDGKAVVTDGFVLLAIDFDYPEELENQTTDKNLKPIKTGFPAWKSVSPKQKEHLNIDPKKILEATNKIKKIFGLKYTGIKIGDEYYYADYINKILNIAPDVEIYKDKYGDLVLENDNFLALKTPLRKDTTESDDERIQEKQGEKLIYTIEEALKYEPKPVIKFKDGNKTLDGKVIDSFTIGNKKFDMVYEPKGNDVYSVLNNEAVEYTYPGKDAKERLIERTKETLKYSKEEKFSESIPEKKR